MPKLDRSRPAALLARTAMLCAGLAALAATAGCNHDNTGRQLVESQWKHHVTLRVVERAGVSARRFPVSFELDTAALAAAGKCRPDGGDIRITVAGLEAPVQLEKTPSGKMLVTFQLDIGAGKAREDVVLHYGNPWTAMPVYDASWGRISPERNSFENELLRASYGLKTSDSGRTAGCQTEFTIKRYDEDQFGGEKVAESWARSRNDVIDLLPAQAGGPRFEVEVDGPIYKRVRFRSQRTVADGSDGKEGTAREDLWQRVTLYRNCPFVKEEYTNIAGPVVDTAAPGGMPTRTDGQRNFDFAAYLFDSSQIAWGQAGDDQEARGGFTASRAKAQDKPGYGYIGDHLYNTDWLIAGVFNVHNGRGIGSCAKPVEEARFVDWPHEQAGYTLLPGASRRLERYLYYVESGGEVISRGKLLAAPPAVSMWASPDPPLDAGGDNWGRIEICRDSAGQLSVLLENTRILVRYEMRVHEAPETYIRQFVLKQFDESQGSWLDSAAHRTGLRQAEIVRNTPAVKTVRLAWEGSTRAGNFAGPAISEVSIFPDSAVLRIDYIQPAFAHICDIGTPGGLPRNAELAIYGAEEWQRQRKQITDPGLTEHPNEHHRVTGDLFPHYPFPLIDKDWGPTALSYKGWYIMGAYNPANGRGFGRVVQVQAVPLLKLLVGGDIPGTGFEFFPHWRGKWKPFTSYLFAATGGAEGIIATGRRIADDAGAGSPELPDR